MFPALRFELVGVGAEVIGPPMHGPDRVAYDLAFEDEDGGFPVRAAAEWEDGVGRGLAAVDGDDGVEAESCDALAFWTGKGGGVSLRTFVHDCPEVFHPF